LLKCTNSALPTLARPKTLALLMSEANALAEANAMAEAIALGLTCDRRLELVHFPCAAE
jgi:hypothetical protein